MQNAQTAVKESEEQWQTTAKPILIIGGKLFLCPPIVSYSLKCDYKI